MTLDECIAADMTNGEIAAALGIATSTVSHMTRRSGTTLRCGRTVPVQRGDQVWPSIKDAAAALGVTRSTAERHLAKYGNLDRVGTPAGAKKGCTVDWRCQPVTIGSRTWPSKSALARHLGISRFQLQRRLDHDRASLIGLLMVREARAEQATRKERMADMVDRVHERRAA